MTLHQDYLHLHSALLNEDDLILPICLARSSHPMVSLHIPKGQITRPLSLSGRMDRFRNRLVWIASEHGWEPARVILEESGAEDQGGNSMDQSKEIL